MKDRNATATAAQNVRRMSGATQDTGPIRRQVAEISELIDGNPWRVCQACGQPSVEAFCVRPECLTHGSGAIAAGPSIAAEADR